MLLKRCLPNANPHSTTENKPSVPGDDTCGTGSTGSTIATTSPSRSNQAPNSAFKFNSCDSPVLMLVVVLKLTAQAALKMGSFATEVQKEMVSRPKLTSSPVSASVKLLLNDAEPGCIPAPEVSKYEMFSRLTAYMYSISLKLVFPLNPLSVVPSNEKSDSSVAPMPTGTNRVNEPPKKTWEFQCRIRPSKLPSTTESRRCGRSMPPCFRHHS